MKIFYWHIFLYKVAMFIIEICREEQKIIYRTCEPGDTEAVLWAKTDVVGGRMTHPQHLVCKEQLKNQEK